MPIALSRRLACGLTLIFLAVAAQAAVAASPLASEGPVSREFDVRGLDRLPTMAALPVDREAARVEDIDREAAGLAPRFALPQDVRITPETDGVWEQLDEGWMLWRLRITAPGAMSLNLGFTGYRLPKNSRLTIHPADAVAPDDPRGVRIFTEQDNEAHGELWTPVVIGDDIVVELLLPAASRHDYLLELTRVNRGYRFFGELIAEPKPTSPAPATSTWSAPRATTGARRSTRWASSPPAASTFCTGAMVNNTAEDDTPYFLTANHCGISSGNAASLVVYWNFQSPVCGQQGGGLLNHFQTGSTFRRGATTSDFTPGG